MRVYIYEEHHRKSCSPIDFNFSNQLSLVRSNTLPSHEGSVGDISQENQSNRTSSDENLAWEETKVVMHRAWLGWKIAHHN